METLKKKYNEEITPALIEKFGYTSKMEVPKLEKIVLNMGVGDATTDSKYFENHLLHKINHNLFDSSLLLINYILL